MIVPENPVGNGSHGQAIFVSFRKSKIEIRIFIARKMVEEGFSVAK